MAGCAALVPAAARAQDWRAPGAVAPEKDAPLWPALERIRLWPGTPPGGPPRAAEPGWRMFGDRPGRQLWIRGIATPEIHVFRPARPDGSALLALPGGGYGFLSVQNEGLNVAQRFNAEGTSVFVLAYRLPGEGWANRHLVPLQDAQRAMRLLRARAGDLRIDPRRLGVIGFSAGGHLAADLATASAEPVYRPVDAADRQSARPAFAGLVYPVTGLTAGLTHGGSRDNLLGPAPSAALVAARSPLGRVGPDTPPSFLVHAADDDLVPIDNSLRWLAACRAAGIPCEAHLFDSGGHGFGLGLPPGSPGALWPELFALWLRRHGG